MSISPALTFPPHVRAGSLTRFAPAPTGWLHLGHVLNACCVWNAAGALAGRVLLRIEDHDRERCRPEYEAGILDDLDWLGFVPDVYPTSCFRAGRCEGRQSDRQSVYDEALQALVEQHLVYACGCSRKQLTAAGPPAGAERPYPGTCRDRGLPLTSGYGWRVRIEPTVERFDDVRLGPQVQHPAAQCGDILIRDRLGNWTYQFCAAVDDYRQGVEVVIRGIDLLQSTGRQIYLGRLLGRSAPPVFMHHRLIMKSATQKLSKADGATGIRQLREGGWSRDRILAAAAAYM